MPVFVPCQVGVQLERVVSVQPKKLGDVQGVQDLGVLENKTPTRNRSVDLEEIDGFFEEEGKIRFCF